MSSGDTTPQAAAGAGTDTVGMVHGRRNHILGVTAGAIGVMGQAFLRCELIFAGLIYALTGSLMYVAIVSVINKGGVLAFQLLASTFLEHRPKKMPYYVAIILLRAAAYASLIGVMWMLTWGVAPAVLTLFFGVYLLSQIFGGTGYVLYMDMVGRMIPRHRLGSYFGARNFLGNALAIAAGLFIVQPLLTRENVPLPSNYLLVVLIGAVLSTVSMIVFTRCREEDGPSAKERTTLAESLRRGAHWLRTDHNYRMYFWVRVAFRINIIGFVFFIPYGSEKLRAGDRTAVALLGGLLVAVMQASRVLFSVVWGRLADRTGFRVCFAGAGACFTLAPALALLAPRLPTTFVLPLPGLATSLDLPLAVYLLALIAIAAAMQASMIGGNHFVVSCAPPDRRPSYLGFANTVTSPLALLAIPIAWLAPRTDVSAVFLITLVAGLASLAAALRMRSPANPAADRR